MDILSFILGICTMLVVGSLTVGVIAFFKVTGLKKQVNDVEANVLGCINQERKDRENSVEDVFRTIDNVSHEIDDVRKTIDSRYDKLDSKISRVIEPKRFNP